MMEFTLKKGEEYIELVKLLKIKQLVQSGGHAKLVIGDGKVKVNGKVEFRVRNKLRKNDVVEFNAQKIKILGFETDESE